MNRKMSFWEWGAMLVVAAGLGGCATTDGELDFSTVFDSGEVSPPAAEAGKTPPVTADGGKVSTAPADGGKVSTAPADGGKVSTAPAGGGEVPVATVDRAGDPSAIANATADRMMYQPVEYVNRAIRGVPLVVLPGQIKSSNATFTQKFGDNNIADLAELELGKANFPILERAHLAEMMEELTLAYNMGDAKTARRLFQMGQYKTTKYIVVFDVVKAESVAGVANSFDGKALGDLIHQLAGSKGEAFGNIIGSIKSGETAEVWVIGLRYKLLDANTTEQVGNGYLEDKMETGSQQTEFLGISDANASGITLDTAVQRLMQKAVAEIDSRYKGR